MKYEWSATHPSTIREFYTQEFPNYVSRLPSHITPAGPLEYGLSLMREHPLQGGYTTDWARRATRDPNDPFADEDAETTPLFANDGKPSMDRVVDFIQRPDLHDPRRDRDAMNALVPLKKREDWDPQPDVPIRGYSPEEFPAEPVQEAVYYRLFNHETGWVLMFDIDADDVAHWRLAGNYPDVDGKEAVLEAADIESEPPVGFDYTFDDVDRALEYAFMLSDFLRDALVDPEFLHVYSGQGAHIYVFDENVPLYSKQTREGLKDIIRESKYIQIPVDPVVTQSRDRLSRLPFSLHTEVSRMCVPIDSPDFDYRNAAVPEVIR